MAPVGHDGLEVIGGQHQGNCRRPPLHHDGPQTGPPVLMPPSAAAVRFNGLNDTNAPARARPAARARRLSEAKGSRLLDS